MKKSEQILKKYCTNCGLCNSYFQKKINEHNLEFDDEQLNFCKNICPASGKHLYKESSTTWGNYKAVYEAYSNDDEIRYKSASGGVTTTIAVYLIEKNIVDGIIQIGADLNNPFSTKVFCNKTKEEILQCTGSRYIVSEPLNNIMEFFKDDKKYAFIGRPCDVIALNNFFEIYPQYKKYIYCTLTFFCAGAPTQNASVKLANQFGVEEKECKYIHYRGNGWPGKTTVIEKNGKEHKMEYIDSWSNILGRDVLPICRFCTDGIGELADISSGDLWYLSKDNTPIFEEKPGVNMTFARSDIGKKILLDANHDGKIFLKNYESKIKELEFIQPYHAIRRKTIFPKIMALRVLGKEAPMYDGKILKKYSQDRTLKQNLFTFLGTIKRVIKGKI